MLTEGRLSSIWHLLSDDMIAKYEHELDGCSPTPLGDGCQPQSLILVLQPLPRPFSTALRSGVQAGNTCNNEFEGQLMSKNGGR